MGLQENRGFRSVWIPIPHDGGASKRNNGDGGWQDRRVCLLWGFLVSKKLPTQHRACQTYSNRCVVVCDCVCEVDLDWEKMGTWHDNSVKASARGDRYR